MGKKHAVTATDHVRREWSNRVTAEYRSAALTQNLTLWLIQIGASPDLIDDGLRIVKDELVHAELSFEAFLEAGGEAPDPLDRARLGLRARQGELLELAAARACVELFCLGETVAVPLFKVLREGCTVAVARRALDRILKDEVRHRDFGWALLDHLLELPGEDGVRSEIERELPGMLARVRKNYGGASKPGELPPEERAWGLMHPSRYREILERTLTRDYVPRFRERGFDAAAAWGG